MKSKKAGWVYILTNQAMPKLVKIGLTRKDPRIRASDLYTTGVPQPFKVYAKLKVSNPEAVEAKLHKRFNRYRVNHNREFFTVKPATAHRALYEAAGRRSQSHRLLTTVITLLVIATLGAYIFLGGI